MNPRSRVRPAAAGGSVLLRPGWVRLLGTECVFEHLGSLFVLHDSAALDPKEELLSRISQSGRILWTHKLAALATRPRSEPFGAVEHDGHVHVFLGQGKRYSKKSLEEVRLDPRTGHILARHALVLP